MQEPLVNVGILTSSQIEFELYGSFRIDETDEEISGKFKAYIDKDRVKIENNGTSFYISNKITFSPKDFDEGSFLLKDVIIGIQFHWEQKEDQRFLGSLKILKDGDSIIAINIIPVESYLTSVISSEMSATSSPELLKAHAVISRSWLLAQMEKSNELQDEETIYSAIQQNEDELIKWYDREDHTLFDVCSDDHCQRYQGITKLHSDTAAEAIEATFGLVLTNNEKICDTRYSKCCGGISESFKNVWEPVEHEYMQKIVDYKFEPDGYDTDLRKEEAARKWILTEPAAFCNTKDQEILTQVLMNFDQSTTDFYRWTVEYTQDEIAKLINDKSGIDFGDIIDLVPVERGHSGRLIKLKIVGSNKTLTIGKELEIRRTLSKSHLYSSAFIVEKEGSGNIPDKFILKGAGWGHGVGLCQIGAAVMGEMGYTFDEILFHYFKNTKLERKYR